MPSLDNLQEIKKLDPGRVLESITMFDRQLDQVWQEFPKVKVPQNHKEIDKIIVNGMGGSALGAHILRSVFFDQLKVPFGVINSYKFPASLDKKTLYIISSYSGNTEEPLSTIVEAKKRGAKIFGITAGGKLGSLIKQGKLPGYVFKPSFNPSAQPRMGLGYSFAAQAGLLQKLGLIKISDQKKKSMSVLAKKFGSRFGVSRPLGQNPAKKLALILQNKIPVIAAAEFLAGNAHTFANQINENAKTFSSYFLISELNHHLLEGLSFPKTNQQNLFFIFFSSKIYHPKNQARFKVTQQVLTKNKIKFFDYKLSAADPLSAALEMLIFGGYASFYLAILNRVNPSKIPWVDYFKTQLKKYH